MKSKMLLFVLLLLASTTAPSFAIGLIVVDEAHWWPGPVPPVPPGPIPPQPIPPRPIPPWPPEILPPRYHPHVFAPLEVQEVKAHAHIRDQIATTTITEQFYNPNSARLESTFLFPVPKGAHIDKFSMDIDGQQVAAELLSASKARDIYEEIVRKAKDPALMEYAGQDMFKVRIFPIEPHSKKKVKVSYTELLKSESGFVQYTLPLRAEKFSCKPVKGVAVKVEIESKRSLKSIYSPSHDIDVERHETGRATVSYESGERQTEGDLTLFFAAEKDEVGVNLLAHKEPNQKGYFLLLASPGIDVNEKQVLPKDVAFVLDTSGSMAGKKMEQAKKALEFCVNSLNKIDRFEILRFSTEVEPLFDKLVAANEAHREKALDFIRELKATGGTAIDDAMKQALALRNRSKGRDDFHVVPDSNAGNAEGSDGDDVEVVPTRSNPGRPFLVIFLTDGRPTIGTTDEEQIVASVKKRSAGKTRIFCFGIGTDVNTRLLDKITEETRAASQYVLPEEDIEVKVSNFFAKIKDPVLADPRISVSGPVHVSDMYPAPLPDLFKGDQLIIVGRYTGSGSAAVQTTGRMSGSQKSFTIEPNFPDENSDNAFIPRLWATRRVGYLLDQIRLHGENKELKEEATELARKYGIVTPYTAYLIVEDEAAKALPGQVRSFGAFQSDREALSDAKSDWLSMLSQTEGEKAIGTARMYNSLKAANSSSAAMAAGNYEAQRAMGLSGSPLLSTAPATPPTSSHARVVQYAQQSQFTGGKTFFLNDNRWIDSEVQKHPDAKHIQIAFGSPEYFELAAKYSEASKWLAVANSVDFYVEGMIYEIR